MNCIVLLRWRFCSKLGKGTHFCANAFFFCKKSKGKGEKTRKDGVKDTRIVRFFDHELHESNEFNQLRIVRIIRMIITQVSDVIYYLRGLRL